MNKTFVAIDFETATKNYNSACSVGVVLFNSRQILEEHYYLIQPPNNEYNKDNINIHKITPQDTENFPTFDGVWENIKHLFNGEHIVIAQNANFDMSVLKSSLNAYNLPYNEFTYWDSIHIATFIVPDDVRKGLASLTAYFNIQLDNHHNALCDAKACAEICMICFNEMSKDNYYVKKDGNFKQYIVKKLSYSFSELEPTQNIGFKRQKKNNYKSNYKNKSSYYDKFANASKFQQNLNADKNNPFYNKNIAVTGDISTYSREKLFEVISNNGGIVKNGVSKQTDILIIGKQDKSLIAENTISSKEKKAKAYISDGCNIELFDENKVLGILENLK